MRKTASLWDSASSDDDVADDTTARRFFQQNMRAVDEELSKIDEESRLPPPQPIPSNSRKEQMLQRQRRAILGLPSDDTLDEEIPVEPSASVDDFECVAMDLDSPKHRTQSESNENTQTTVEAKNNDTGSFQFFLF